MPRYDTVVRLAEHGFRIDDAPSTMAPQALAVASATAYANTRVAEEVATELLDHPVPNSEGLGNPDTRPMRAAVVGMRTRHRCARQSNRAFGSGKVVVRRRAVA